MKTNIPKKGGARHAETRYCVHLYLRIQGHRVPSVQATVSPHNTPHSIGTVTPPSISPPLWPLLRSVVSVHQGSVLGPPPFPSLRFLLWSSRLLATMAELVSSSSVSEFWLYRHKHLLNNFTWMSPASQTSHVGNISHDSQQPLPQRPWFSSNPPSWQHGNIMCPELKPESGLLTCSLSKHACVCAHAHAHTCTSSPPSPVSFSSIWPILHPSLPFHCSDALQDTFSDSCGN